MAKSETETSVTKRKHKATYATDKRNGGYLIRVAGPHANKFAGREVPVTTRDGAEHLEELEKMVWAGKDEQNGEPVALYKFKAKPQEKLEVEF